MSPEKLSGGSKIGARGLYYYFGMFVCLSSLTTAPGLIKISLTRIQTQRSNKRECPLLFFTFHTFFRNFPLMWHSLGVPSKQCASSLPFPSILMTWAYSCPSSLKISSLFSFSFSFLPLRRFLPPFPGSEGSYSTLERWCTQDVLN